MCGKDTFSITAGIFQIALLIAFAITVDYAPTNLTDDGASEFYSFFQDVHVMIFVGFGFLMTFLKKYSYGAVGYNLFISALVIQWATLVNGWFGNLFDNSTPLDASVHVDLKTLIVSDFAAAAVLITFGAVLGKVSRFQLLVIGTLEVLFYAINENIVLKCIKVTDVGGSMVIHMFGAYFGLAVARVLYNEKQLESDKEGSVYHSDVFAMIGTIFLWMFWPSFNAGLLGPGAQQHRAIINTYYSLAACCIATFVVSPLVNKKRKLDMVHVQNASLAGGVAVGTCADLMIQPWGAMLIGIIAGVISTLGYAYVTPFLTARLKIHDTCGVHNLHGMPAILAGLAGAVAAATANSDKYGLELYDIWSKRSPVNNTLLVNGTTSFKIVQGRSAISQGGYQFAAVVVTLIISIVGGALTGLLVRFLDAPEKDDNFDDHSYWLIPEDDVNSSGADQEMQAILHTDDKDNDKDIQA